MRAIILLTLTGLGLAGCSNVFDKHVEYKYVEPNNYPILKAVGYAPISLQQGANKSQKQLMAIKASKLEAYRELTEQVYGQKITAGTSVAGAIAQNDYMESKVQGIIKGAQIIKTYSVDDVYVTELELNMKRVHDLYIGEIKPREVKKVTYY
ncbi:MULTISPECIES: LPP20 family lipoprotein [unclassified Pseudoalteromonas]|uniref:LPP20 family lipoprotein n=1 Tax=unclassified Pseudoalteromonas TaxID=194690 RepID=UPI000EDD680B|nr:MULTISPECIES: LPP20 family lipoprotein [unclassified Pseudoalteromonas]HAG38663.1 flagellar biosynthesis protein FlgP [Pseudoalteromonas sp.]|tara:strand:+ start:936 stop:1391 length:456 start_codon:yes stop_codon:yes gene_type:complete